MYNKPTCAQVAVSSTVAHKKTDNILSMHKVNTSLFATLRLMLITIFNIMLRNLDWSSLNVQGQNG